MFNFPQTVTGHLTWNGNGTLAALNMTDLSKEEVEQIAKTLPKVGGCIQN
ncbi:MAG TPA: hypothetical protein VFA76_04660 [Terriglobales bacterium]|nr:hypothetical protein [Terriglobales bacterium]